MQIQRAEDQERRSVELEVHAKRARVVVMASSEPVIAGEGDGGFGVG